MARVVGHCSWGRGYWNGIDCTLRFLKCLPLLGPGEILRLVVASSRKIFVSLHPYLYENQMKIKEVAAALERFAPLPLQESYDNAGLQIGLTGAEDVSGVLLCLDVTEAIIDEAVSRHCNVVVSHHPLLFRGVKCVDESTLVTRCLRRAIAAGVTVYAAHTNLDNARGGVNWRMAERLGLTQPDFLQAAPDGQSGSGLIGKLPAALAPLDFLKRAKTAFGVACLMHNDGPARPVRRIALCGGAGDFLLDTAVAQGADVFLTGEMGYHRYFGYENDIWIGVLGHYQSEQFTVGLMHDILKAALPDLRICQTDVCTNPIRYMC